ncbi:MAG TPA: hypothetical protein VLA66_11925 [Thermoanaerobaculia bacterium]|nr:hypothetical protein [Thermoanaerobaculia bacterium]
MKTRLALGAAAVSLWTAACATTTFTSSWKAPDARPLELAAGDKVVAIVMSDSTSLRRAGEANLADELDHRGLKGVPAYTLLSDQDVRDEAKARTAIEASGAVAVVAMRPLGSEQEVTSTPSTYVGGSYWGAPYYGGFWGGYYGHGWGGAWIPGEVRTDTYVHIETLVYDLRQNKLVWAGRTKTMNPSDVQGAVVELAAAVAQELRKSGLIAKK